MQTIDDIDLTDTSLFAGGPPIREFRTLRENDPVHWCPPPPEWKECTEDGQGFWSLTRASDIARVGSRLDTFSAHRSWYLNYETDGMAPLETLSTMLLGMQPPKHTQVRSLLSKAFVPRTMASLETPIRELVTDLIDKVIDRGECDLVNDIAVPLPLVVIAKLIGFPEDSTERFHDWSLRFVAIQDSEARGGGAEETVKALEEISAYANEVAELRRRDPRDDLLSILANAEIDGVRMDEFEIAGMVVQLIGAGNETSRNTLSLGIMGMLENRDQWDRLTADRGLVGVAVEEMLRWVSPVYYMRRTATVDTELEGKTIRTGDKVVQWLVAANYDPELNDNPEVLDITRPRVRHYAFGAGGPKFCLGSALARLELRVALDELARRLPDLEICGPSHRMQSNFLNSLLSLPVRF